MRDGTRLPVGPDDPGKDYLFTRHGFYGPAVISLFAIGNLEFPILENLKCPEILGDLGEYLCRRDIGIFFSSGTPRI